MCSPGGCLVTSFGGCSKNSSCLGLFPLSFTPLRFLYLLTLLFLVIVFLESTAHVSDARKQFERTDRSLVIINVLLRTFETFIKSHRPPLPFERKPATKCKSIPVALSALLIAWNASLTSSDLY